MPGPVDDRTVLMRTTETNLEPILLVHEGTDRLRDADRQGRRRRARSPTSSPSTAARTGSGPSRDARRCWPRSRAELAGTQALIADGHHRYAAYLRLQEELRDPAAADGDVPVGPRAGAARRPARPPAPRSGRSTARSAPLTMSDLQESPPTAATTSGTSRTGRPRSPPRAPRTRDTDAGLRSWSPTGGPGPCCGPGGPARSTPRCCTRCCCPPGGWPRSRSATTTASTRRCTPRRGSPASSSPCGRRRWRR